MTCMPLRARFFALLLCLSILPSFWTLAHAASDPAASPTTATAPPDPRPNARAVSSPQPEAGAGETETTDTEAEPAEAAPSEPAAEPAEQGALVEGGLLAQVFALFDQWTTGLGDQLREATSALGDLRNIDRWWDTAFRTPEAEREALRGIAELAVILAIALAAEWLVHWLLRRPRRLVAQQANVRELQAQERDTVREAHLTAIGTEVAPAHQGVARASRDALR